MDIITIAISTSIARGISTITANQSEHTLSVDAYKTLKIKLSKHFKSVAEVVDKLEANPASEGYKLVLHEMVTKYSVDQDRDILKTAQALQDTVAS